MERPKQGSAGPPILRHSQAASLLFMQLADQHWAEVYLPDCAPFGLESDVLPHEGFAHKAANPLPTNLPVAFDPASFPAGWIFPSFASLGQPPGVLLKEIDRPPHAQSLVRALVIVSPQPKGASLLLRRHGARGPRRHFCLVNAVKLLVRTVFARPPGGDEFHHDPQLDPPRAQPRQARRPGASKRRAVIAADPLGQPMLGKEF